MTPTSALDELQRCLNAGGLSAGLEFLNKRVLHRFTAVYQFEGDAFKLMAMFDKLHEAVPDLLGFVPFDESFCQYSVGLGQFVTSDSMEDHRLDGHIHQATVASYVGLPLTRPQGGLYGSLCHFDLVRQRISDPEFAFLQEATPVVAQYLPLATAPAGH